MVSMNKKSVLVIEDSQYLAESLVDALELHGYAALVAASGREGVLKAEGERPDLILLDIRLPDIDGYEVYQQIRKFKWGEKANIIVLTASESIENIAKNINLSTEHILFKPDWSLPDILKKIDSVLED